MFRKQSAKASERVIVNEEVIDVAALRAEAKQAGTRFWVLVLLISLLSSMVVPYLSMASVAASDTAVFDGDVIPGYSMGGIDITAYGVDLNEWANPKPDKQTTASGSPSVVRSQYGYWTAERAENAVTNLTKSIKADDDKDNADLNGFEVRDEMMTNDEKARGWIGITRDGGEGTGLSGFSQNPLGTAVEGRTGYNESVAPYRTSADYAFWDSQSIGGTSPSIVATLYPDFVILGWDEENQTARVLTNPDSIQNDTNAKSDAAGAGTLNGTAAVPHYVPLSTLFKEFGLGDTVMKDGSMVSLDTLMDAIKAEAQENGGKSKTLNKIVKNESKNKREGINQNGDYPNDLLLGTMYRNFNSKNGEYSDAWNPYPYSMVFKMSAEGGTIVSSIYNNTEAYVYFSPRSVYTNYMALRAEYDALVNSNATAVANADPASAFQLGYYLAGMSILEAYLNEALPQDMTRGYVGPAEGNPLASAGTALTDAAKLDTRSTDASSVSTLFKQSLSEVDQMATMDESGVASGSDSGEGGGGGAVGFKSVVYSQLMYDFADAAIVKYKQVGQKLRLGSTSAIMNTLSTYGYGTNEDGKLTNGKTSAGQGPNRGMTRKQNMARVTSFGPYGTGAETLAVSIAKDGDDPMINPSVTNDANTGFYIPVYYPIQQHVMPTDPEMTYRFQVLSLIPYNTLAYELGRNGFNSRGTLTYTNNAIESLTATKNYYNKNASLTRQLDDLDEDGGSLAQYDKSRSIVLNPQSNATAMVGDQSSREYSLDKDLTDRVDNALRAFTTGRLNSDNVHDLVDVVRSIPGVKYETFVRYFNPIKSSGGATDIFLTRVTPAQTAYMPSILTKGYESAGGVTNSSNTPSTTAANFDYFSIPSLGPCFAAHTAEDTYYGALTYELRPFYTGAFLSSLPADANIPALEQYLAKVEEKEEVSEDTAIEDVKQKVMTIYVLAKRLAFANAYGTLVAAQDGKEGSVSLGSLYYGSNELADILPASDAVKKALTPNNLDQLNGPETDNGKSGVDENVQEGVLQKKDSGQNGGNGGTSGGGGGGGGTTSTVSSGNGDQGTQEEAGTTSKGGYTYLYMTMEQFKEAWAQRHPVRNGAGGVAEAISLFSTSMGGLYRAGTDQWWVEQYNSYCVYVDQINLREQNEDGDREARTIAFATSGGQKGVIRTIFNRWDEDRKSANQVDLRDLRARADYVTASRWGGMLAVAVIRNTHYYILEPLISAFPVSTGDYIGSTTTSGTGQTTAYYDNGDGTTTAVAYVSNGTSWVAQAESTSTVTPAAGSLNTGAVNGLPSMLLAAESTEPVDVPGTDDTAETPVDATDTDAAKADDQAATPATGTVSDEVRNNKVSASDASASDTASGDASASASASDSSDNTGDGPYADNGGAADTVYKNEGLGALGYIKATDAQWKEIAGKHGVGDMVTFHIPKDMKFPVEGGFDYVMEQFGQKHILSDDILGNKTIWCKESNGYAFVTSVKSIFSALYKDAYGRYLTPTGSTYYWDTPENIAGYGVKADLTDLKDGEMSHYNTVAMEYAKATDSASAKSVLDNYCNTAFEEAGKCLAALRMLNDEMPAQMQNVLAWADTQTASESEQNYMTDPSDADATLVAISGDDSDDGTPVGTIRSFADLKAAGFKVIENNGEWAAVVDSSANSTAQPNEMNSRMVRGVAGTTYTASNSLAAYTISATVGRIDRIVSTQSSTSSIPYAGIYSGNLNSGSERYALIQGHSIDRQAIASRLAGDLRSRDNSSTLVALNNPNSTAETQSFVKNSANVTGELLSSAIPDSASALTEAMSTVTSSDTTTQSLQTSTPANASSIFGTSEATKSMAAVSTFDNITMNRKSSVTQTFDSSKRKMVGSGASATAAADNISDNRNMANALVDGTFSDAYATIQSIALIMVLVFLMIIAFQNFVGYTSGSESDYISAQTKLKTVLPRALIAVAMIGLPPIGGGLGFQGGCYLLLQIVNAIMDAVLGVFTQGNTIGDSIASISGQFGLESVKFSFDLGAVVLNLIAALVFMLCSAVIILLVALTNIVLFFFWALGPIAWAFYVWPYSADEQAKLSSGHGLKKVLGTMTGKMGSKMFTNGSIGRDAPSGWLMGYVMTLSTVVKWVLLFWGADIVFSALHEGSNDGILTTINSAMADDIEITQVDAGSLLLGGAAKVLDGVFGNLLLALLFALLTYMTFRSFKNSMGGALGTMYGLVGNAVTALGKTAGTNVFGRGIKSLAGAAGNVTERMKQSDSMITKVAGGVLDAPVKFAEKVPDAIETIANGPGSKDLMNRVNKMTDNLAKPVNERADSSGAFDDLISVGTIEEEYTDEKTGEKKKRKRQVIQAAPSLQMGAQLTAATMGSIYQGYKSGAALTRAAYHATALGRDKEYLALKQQQGLSDFAGELEKDMQKAAGAKHLSAEDKAKFVATQQAAENVGNLLSGKGSASAADIKMVTQQLRDSVKTDGYAEKLGSFQSDMARIAELRGSTDQSAKAELATLESKVKETEKFASMLGTDAATLAKQIEGTSDEGTSAILSDHIHEMENMLLEANKDGGEKFKDLSARKGDIERHRADEISALEGIAESLKNQGVASDAALHDMENIIANAKGGVSTPTTAAIGMAISEYSRGASNMIGNLDERINQGGRVTDKQGNVRYTLGTHQASQAMKQVAAAQNDRSVTISEHADLFDGAAVVADYNYLTQGTTGQLSAAGPASSQPQKQLQQRRATAVHKMNTSKNAATADQMARLDNRSYNATRMTAAERQAQLKESSEKAQEWDKTIEQTRKQKLQENDQRLQSANQQAKTEWETAKKAISASSLSPADKQDELNRAKKQYTDALTAAQKQHDQDETTINTSYAHTSTDMWIGRVAFDKENAGLVDPATQSTATEENAKVQSTSWQNVDWEKQENRQRKQRNDSKK